MDWVIDYLYHWDIVRNERQKWRNWNKKPIVDTRFTVVKLKQERQKRNLKEQQQNAAPKPEDNRMV